MGNGKGESLPLKEGGAQRRKIEWLAEPQITKIVAKRHLLAMHYALCTMHYALCTMHYALCTINHSKGEIIMNKIFKVVYSKARHMKVVVSEIAKTHGKGKRLSVSSLVLPGLLMGALLHPTTSFASLQDVVANGVFIGCDSQRGETFDGYSDEDRSDSWMTDGGLYTAKYIGYDPDDGKYKVVTAQASTVPIYRAHQIDPPHSVNKYTRYDQIFKARYYDICGSMNTNEYIKYMATTKWVDILNVKTYTDKNNLNYISDSKITMSYHDDDHYTTTGAYVVSTSVDAVLSDEEAAQFGLGSGTDKNGNNTTGDDNTDVNGKNNNTTGNNDKVTGDGNNTTGNDDTIKGNNNNTTGDNDTITGKDNNTTGDRDNVTGDGNNTYGNDDDIDGSQNNTTGNNDDIDGNNNNTTGDRDEVTGDGNNTYGNDDDIDGSNNNTTGNNDDIDGNNNNTTGDRDNVTGDGNNTYGNDDDIDGSQNNTTGNNDDIDGNNNNTTGDRDKVTGSSDNTYGNDDVIDGSNDNTVGNNDEVTGDNNNTTGDRDKVTGSSDNTYGNDDVIDGSNDNTVGNNDEVTGDNNNTTGDRDKVTGNSNNTYGNDDTIDGSNNNTEGNNDKITGDNNTTDGNENEVKGDRNNTTGYDNTVTGDENNTYGNENKIKGTGNDTYGNENEVTGDDNINIGRNNKIDGSHSTVIGRDSYVAASNAGAIGNNAVATESDVVSFGHSVGDPDGKGGTYTDDYRVRLTNVADGVNLNDAVNLHQLADTEGRLQGGVAGAAALAALRPMEFDPDEKVSFAVGFGNYKHAKSCAIGTFIRPNDSVMVSLGGAFGSGENVFNVGLSFKLGKKAYGKVDKRPSVSTVEILSQNEKLKAEVANLHAEIDQMKAIMKQALGIEVPDIPAPVVETPAPAAEAPKPEAPKAPAHILEGSGAEFNAVPFVMED